MKKKITVKSTKEVEIEFPMYFKLTIQQSYFALVSPESAIMLWGNNSIATTMFPEILVEYTQNADCEIISKEEFQDRLITEVILINSKLN